MGRGEGIDRSAPSGMLDDLAERRDGLESVSQLRIARAEQGRVVHCEIEQVGDDLHLQALMEVTDGRYQGECAALDVPVIESDERYRQLCQLLAFNPESFLLPAMMSTLCEGKFKGIVEIRNGRYRVEQLISATLPDEEDESWL